MKSAWARGARGGPPPPPARASETRGPEGRKREPRVEPGIVPGSGRVPARGPAAPHGLNRFRHSRRRGLGLAEPRFPHPRSRAPATRRPAPRLARGRPRAPPAQACDEGGPLSRRRGRDSPRAAGCCSRRRARPARRPGVLTPCPDGGWRGSRPPAARDPRAGHALPVRVPLGGSARPPLPARGAAKAAQRPARPPPRAAPHLPGAPRLRGGRPDREEPIGIRRTYGTTGRGGGRGGQREWG